MKDVDLFALTLGLSAPWIIEKTEFKPEECRLVGSISRGCSTNDNIFLGMELCGRISVRSARKSEEKAPNPCTWSLECTGRDIRVNHKFLWKNSIWHSVDAYRKPIAG
jgi:hypothetical protein